MAEDASADAVPAHGQAAGGKTLAMPPPVAKDLPMDPPPGKKLSASKSGREGERSAVLLAASSSLPRAARRCRDLADNTRQAAMSAAAEAASAAAHVTPAQRERAIAEAAAKV